MTTPPPLQPSGCPRFGPEVYVAPTAYVCGQVTIGPQTSIWPQVVVRGDIAEIRIGARVNIQDGTIIHTRHGVPLDIEDEVGFGHRAVAHCRRIGRATLVGIGAVLLDDCEIGQRCLIAAGSVLPPSTIVPDGMLVRGVPGKVIRPLTAEEQAYLDHVTANYLQLARAHARGDYPRAFPA
jgi:carbonic anhydrase/acetyltransferase-like protein (isoleucine patch superfamily)